MAWNICWKSIKDGGVGLKSLNTFNAATNLHMCWNLLNGNNGWFAMFSARVRRNDRIINYSIKSSIWSSIKDSFGTVKENIQWLIGNEKKTYG